MAKTLSTAQTKGGFMFGSNPIIRKLSRIEETDSENCCSFGGIITKLIYFMVMVMAGILLNAVMAGRWGGETLKLTEAAITVTYNEAIALVVAAITLIASPILAMLIKITIPVTGALFCASTGFVISWAGSTFGKEYASTIWLALLVTAVVVILMGFLYFSGKVRVTKKFRTVLIVLFLGSIFSSAIVGILSVIPATRPFTDSIVENGVFNIAASVVMIIIASLFLLVDFDTIRRSVDDGLPRKYEWYASFGLAFSIIWLFFKILELLGKMKNNKSS